MYDYSNNLQTACDAALEIDGPKSHLMAQKREDQGDTSWLVILSDSFDEDFVVHMSDDALEMTAIDMREMIENSWDEEWTDVQIENPAGDFSIGSSDFKQRT